MRKINLNDSNNKKVYFVKKKCKAMLSAINEATNTFPNLDMQRGCWHLHLPVSQSFIDSSQTPVEVRKLCMQTLIDRTKYLIDIKPELDVNTRVVALISLPELWESQIIVFFGEDYFSSFFDRDDEGQKWTLFPSDRSLLKELDLTAPAGLLEKGYLEIMYDEDDKDYKLISELWFIGELN